MLDQDEIESIITDPKKRQLTAIVLAGDFQLFIKYVHYAINGSYFTFKPFHLKLIKKLEDIEFGKNVKRNLGISLPVGAGKSILVEYFITWSFCRSINRAYLYTSHSATNIMALSREIKEMFESEFLSVLYGIKLKKDERAKINWSFENAMNRTGLMARPTGAGLTGADAGNPSIKEYSGAVIVDDPVDVGNIRSQVAMEEVIRFYDEKLSTRRRTPTTPSIVIMQRLAKDDLIGWLKKHEPDEWDFLEVPALNDDDTSFWPERYPVEELHKIRALNPNKFHSQYQQDPISAGGNIIKREWFKWYKEYPQFRRIFITTDTAMKIKEHNDYSVFMVWGNGTDGLYLLDLVRGKWEAYDLRQQAMRLWEKWKNGIGSTRCGGFYVEDKASGTGLIQELNRHGLPMIPLERGKGQDKLTRLEGVLDFIFSGKVFLPEDVVSIPDFLEECEAFTRDDSHKHDDQVDTLIDGVNIGLSVANLTVADIL